MFGCHELLLILLPNITGLVAKMRLEKLHEALKCLEKDLLQKAIAEAYQAGVNPKHELLYHAELELDVLNVKDG